VEWGHLGISPLRTVKPYGVDNVRLRVCAPAEIQTLLANAPADLALIARVTLESLLRLSEVLALRREDIGPTRGITNVSIACTVRCDSICRGGSNAECRRGSVSRCWRRRF
jgi:integrase